MGKLLKGINGPFSGKVGTAVGYIWNDIAVIRARPKSRRRPFSEKELNQQARFALMNRFLIPLKNLLNTSFGHLAYRMNGFNKGFSYNVKAAILGFRPDLSIDFPRVLLSRGDLAKAEAATVTALTPLTLQFNWIDQSGTGNARETDQVFVAVFSAEKKRWFYRLNVATRSAGSFTLELKKVMLDPSPFEGKPLQTYIGFMAADGTDASDSVYTGIVNMPAN
ncbi:MAG TPA: DUF6266 family protein [Puia sp.]|nr:DUF6266 family protein [Puia sp.]